MEKCTKCGLDKADNASACACQCTKCKDYVFEPVLAYCQDFLKNYSVIKVAKAVESFFSNEDVTKARDFLRRNYMDQMGDLDIIKIANRRTSNNRSCVEANAYDVTEALYSLMNGDNCPKFMVDDISKLPMLGPDMATPRSQSNVIAMLERKLQRMEEKMSNTDNVLQEHEKMIQENKRTNKNQATKSTLDHGSLQQPAPTFGSLQPPASAPGFGSLQLPAPAPGFGWNRNGGKQVTKSSEGPSLQDGATAPITDEPQDGGSNSWSAIVSKLQNIADGTEWQNVKRKKPNNKRPAPMQGTATGTNIKAGIWVPTGIFGSIMCTMILRMMNCVTSLKMEVD